MKLEDSSGKISEPKSSRDVEAMVERVGRDIDHCILSSNGDFIQAAGSGSGMLVGYNDGGGYTECQDTNLPVETVKKLFVQFFEGDPGWKTAVSFGPQDSASASAAGASMASGPTGPGTATDFEGKGLKNTVMDSVKREAQSSFSYMIRRIVRRFFRRIF